MKAAIDIGTNTVLLLIADVGEEQFQVLREEQRAPRLGEGVDEARNLSTEAMQRVIDVLQNYQKLIEDSYPAVSNIWVTATSAVRDAQNRSKFLEAVKDQTGLEVEVLSGEAEARFTYRGARCVLNEEQIDLQSAVIDIGGGSTEIAVGERGKIRDRYSFDMGCVRFTERYLKDDPLAASQIRECRQAIRQMFEEYEFNFGEETALTGVAGTVTSLAYIDRELDEFQSAALNGHVILLEKLKEYISAYQKMTSEELRRRHPEVMEKRADIFRAGLLILEGFMERHGFEEVITSTGGIRHGALLDMDS